MSATNIDRSLVEAIADAVVERLRGPTATEYSSEHPADGVSRRTHNTRCARGLVAGARREGLIWRCSREAWHGSFAAPKPKGDAYARRTGR